MHWLKKIQKSCRYIITTILDLYFKGQYLRIIFDKILHFYIKIKLIRNIVVPKTFLFIYKATIRFYKFKITFSTSFKFLVYTKNNFSTKCTLILLFRQFFAKIISLFGFFIYLFLFTCSIFNCLQFSTFSSMIFQILNSFFIIRFNKIYVILIFP